MGIELDYQRPMFSPRDRTIPSSQLSAILLAHHRRTGQYRLSIKRIA
jgi:hypothetical protein